MWTDHVDRPTWLSLDGADARPTTPLLPAPDGSRVAAGFDDGCVRTWTAAGHRSGAAWCREGDVVDDLVFGPDSDLLVATWRAPHSPIGTGSAATGAPYALLDASEQAQAVALSADGTRVYARTGDGHLRSWEARSGRLLFERALPAGADAALLVSPADGDVVTATTAGQVHVWTADGAPRAALQVEGQRVAVVALSPAGRLLATSPLRGHVRVWDLASGQLVHQVLDLPARLHDLRFTPEEDRLVGIDVEGVLWSWDISGLATGDPIATAGATTNLRPCRDDYTVAAVQPYPVADSIWAPDAACVGASEASAD